MGIYDREYYRREGPSLFGALGGRAPVCKWLIIINCVAFIVQLATSREHDWFSRMFELQARSVDSGEIWRLLTYAFLHDPRVILHIVFNMLFLWWFGNELEEMYGSREFLAFYLVAAVIGGTAYYAWEKATGVNNPCVGASGAVMAVMVLFAFHFPNRQLLLFFIIPVPVWIVVVGYVALNTFVIVGGVNTTTAVAVHLGGAAFGLAYSKAQWRITKLSTFLPDFRSWRRQWNRPRLRVYHEEPAVASRAAPSRPTREADDQLEARVDAVLEKMARHGQASLTSEERELLVRASEVYKRRRH